MLQFQFYKKYLILKLKTMSVHETYIPPSNPNREMTTEKPSYKSVLMSPPKTKQVKLPRKRSAEEIVNTFLRDVVHRWYNALYENGDWNFRCYECDKPLFTYKRYCSNACQIEEEQRSKACIVCGERDNDYPFCSRSCMRYYNGTDRW